MNSSDKIGGGAGAFVRARVKPAVRRGLARIEPLDRAATRAVGRRARAERLRSMYQVLRRSYFPGEEELAEGDLPTIEQIAEVEAAALRSNNVFGGFFRSLISEADFPRASVDLSRKLIARGEAFRARSIFQVFSLYDEFRPAADICLAICLIGEPMPEDAWTLFHRNDLALSTRLALREHFTVGFQCEPQAAAADLARVLSGEVPAVGTAETWVEIALHSFAAGFEDLSAQALARADQQLAATPADAARLRPRIAALRSWYGRAERAAQAEAAPAGEVSFALTDTKFPDRRASSRNIADAAQALATLGHLARHENVQFTGDTELVTVADRVSKEVAPARRIAGTDLRTVRLTSIERDASRYSAVPPGTWAIVSDWCATALADTHHDLPLNPNVSPIFVSFHITVDALKAPGAIEYLRAHGPIGCIDRDTVFLLHAAGVPAFFSGAIATTVDTVLESGSGNGAGTLFVDIAPDGPGERRDLRSEDVAVRNLAANLTAAQELLGRYRDSRRVVTADLQAALLARAAGTRVDFRPGKAANARIDDLGHLSDTEFAAMQQGLLDKLAAVIGAALEGKPADEVYAVWREVCAADVAAAEAELNSVSGFPSLNFDLDDVCRTIRSESVTVERTEGGTEGSEINVEFSLDGNYKHQLDVVLDSIVVNTRRPVRAFVLCRNHTQADFDRMAKLFPTVSFVWLPTDNVTYGKINSMNPWVTPATMDRTILPRLLGEVDRMLHFDLDAMCLADLGELYDTDSCGFAIVGAPEPQPRYVSGFETYKKAADRIRREGNPALAREFVIRTHSKDHFDFNIFNAGIMVMDLAKMRADDFCGRYLPYVQEFGLNGQIVLNTYTGNKVAEVSGDWNVSMRLQVLDKPKIAHWAGPRKPWKRAVYVAGRELWDEGERRVAERKRSAGVA